MYRRDLYGAHVREVRRPEGQQGRPGERGKCIYMLSYILYTTYVAYVYTYIVARVSCSVVCSHPLCIQPYYYLCKYTYTLSKSSIIYYGHYYV